MVHVCQRHTRSVLSRKIKSVPAPPGVAAEVSVGGGFGSGDDSVGVCVCFDDGKMACSKDGLLAARA